MPLLLLVSFGRSSQPSGTRRPLAVGPEDGLGFVSALLNIKLVPGPTNPAPISAEVPVTPLVAPIG